MNPFSILFGTPWPWWSIVAAGAGAGWFTWRGYTARKGELRPARVRVLNALRLTAWTPA